MAPKRGALADCRVLVLEDESVIAMLIEDMLEELDAEIVGPVASTEAALQAIEDQPPDAATLDISLGGRRAYKAAQELHARSIPFIFVTGYGVRADCPENLSDVLWLKKPFSLDQLATALELVLEQGKAS